MHYDAGLHFIYCLLIINSLAGASKAERVRVKTLGDILTVAGVGPALVLDKDRQGHLQAFPLLALGRGRRHGFYRAA